jgi:hypothetical protein
MSAYKRIKCKIVNKEFLLEALENIGLTASVHEEPVALKGYTGDIRNQKSEIVVDRKQLNEKFTGASNDLGFTWNDKEKAYDIICSEYDAKANVPQRIMQSYAVTVIQKAAKVNNFTLKTSENNKIENKIRQKVKLVFGKVI